MKTKERELLKLLIDEQRYEFTPIEISKKLGVTNKTIINRCAKLANNGFILPVIVKERIRLYQLSDFTKKNKKEIQKML